MADTDNLRQYRVGDPPTLPNSDKMYLAKELKRLSECIGLLVQAAKKSDTTITTTVATLPAAPLIGTRRFVIDASSNVFGAAVAGGGTNKTPVYFDGAWKIG